jgi:hypothetical protein
VKHQSFLQFARLRYLKWALLLSLTAGVPYAALRPSTGHYGGTWLGYALGTVAALLIVWLAWLGIRKRRYSSEAGRLQGWLSAHVYLGLALVVVATLHSAFEVGWNVHTLAYVLMWLVVASGIYGVYAYLRYPALITENLGDDTLDGLLLRIADLDREARAAALPLDDEINRIVLRSAERTALGGSAWKQLRGPALRCATTAALREIERRSQSLPAAQQAAAQALYAALLKKSELLRRARRDIAYRGWLQLWLYVHVPLAIALLAALTAHVVSVFAYW